MRLLQCVIGLVILSAIGSTFFLFRDQAISPKLVHSASEHVAPATQEAAIIVASSETPISSTTSANTVTPDQTSEQSGETSAIVTSPETIIIENTPLTATEVKSLTTRIHSFSNLSRSQNNLPALTLDERLTELAEARSRDMVENGYFSHTTADGCDLSCRFSTAGYHTLVWGENLALTHTRHLYTEEELAKKFVGEWLKSSTHRDNLLSTKYSHYGIGIAEAHDQTVVTVLFARPE